MGQIDLNKKNPSHFSFRRARANPCEKLWRKAGLNK